MLHTVELIEEKAILLAVRPLKIGHRVMTQRFCKYEPSVALFDGSIHEKVVARDLKIALGDEADVMVDGFSGIRVYCGDTECIFEFVTYKYNGVKKKEPTPEPKPSDKTPNNDITRTTQHPGGFQRSQSSPPQEIVAQMVGHHFLQRFSSVFEGTAHQFVRSMSTAVANPAPLTQLDNEAIASGSNAVPNNDNISQDNRLIEQGSTDSNRSNGSRIESTGVRSRGRRKGRLQRSSTVSSSQDSGVEGSLTGREPLRSTSSTPFSPTDRLSEEEEEEEDEEHT